MKCLTILAVVFVIVSGSTMAQTISGKVLDESGIPKRGMDVVLENERGQSVNITSTKPSGEFELGGIPIGKYILKIFSGNKLLGTSNVKVPGNSDVKIHDKSNIKFSPRIDVGPLVVK
jgi:hypothetical protein